MIQILLQGLKVCAPNESIWQIRWIPLFHSITTLQYAMSSLVNLNRAKWQVCAMINACFIPFTEGLAPFRELSRIGPLILLSNAGVAFGLNVAAVFLIGAAGGLVLTLAGVFKVCPLWGEGWWLGYLVNHFELYILWKRDYTYTDPWYVTHYSKADGRIRISSSWIDDL